MVLLCLFIALFTVSAKTIDFEESIVLNASNEEVFYYVADTRNDADWRWEVHSIKTEGDFQVGTEYLEDAFLGVHYHYYTKVALTDLIPYKKALYQTTPDNPFMLKSLRLFEKLGPNKTLFTYKVTVEEDLVYDIWQFQIPLKTVESGYSTLMKLYLKNLQSIFKAQNSPHSTHSITL